MPQFTEKSNGEDYFVEKLQEKGGAACAYERRGAACDGEEGGKDIK